ncbi:MAG: TonB-dependent receptor [Maribacter sp.]
MKYLFLFIIFAMSYNWGFAQNIVSGTITNKEDNLPIEQATVYFPDLEMGTTTDYNGYYELNDVPIGSFEMIISNIGFETYSKNLNVLSGNNTFNISLSSTAIEMEEVIVSTPFHKLQSENVMKVERESMQELSANGAITLSDGITKIAGVESVSTGVGIGKPVIRGLSANRVLVYTQGVRLENQQFGDEHGLGINDAGLESVEVIKGPASLLYGSDAMGGVLYFNPEKFAIPNETEGDVNLNYFTNTNGLGFNIGVKTSSEKLKFLLRGSHASHIDYKTGDDVRLTNSRFNVSDLKTGLGYQSTSFKTELRYNYNLSEIGIPEEIGEQSKSRSPQLPSQQIGNHILSSKTKIFFDKTSLEATLGYTFNNRKEFEDDEDIAALEMHLSTLNYNLNFEMPKWGNLETIIGIQGMHQTNRNYGEEQLIPNANTNDIGVLATSHMHFENKSDLQMGLRFDHRNINGEFNNRPPEDSFYENFDRDFNSFNAALGYKFELFNNTVARINMATGFRAPNLAELTSLGVHEGTNRYEIGKIDLDNEQNFQTDISLEYKDDHLEFFINGFHNSITDYIFIEPTGLSIGEDEVFEYRQQNAKLFGGEIGFHLHPHPLDWLHFESSFETVIGKLESDEYLPLIPANNLTNTVRIEGKDTTKWLRNKYAFITLKSVFNQNKVGGFEDPSDGYNLLNLGIGANISAFNTLIEVRVSGQNIMDKAYISHLSRLKNDGIANIGRNISLAVGIPL